MIVKVQRPIGSSPAGAPFLVYAEGKRFRTFVPPSAIPASALAAMGDDDKAYFEARLRNGEWLLERRVAEQEW